MRLFPVCVNVSICTIQTISSCNESIVWLNNRCTQWQLNCMIVFNITLTEFSERPSSMHCGRAFHTLFRSSLICLIPTYFVELSCRLFSIGWDSMGISQLHVSIIQRHILRKCSFVFWLDIFHHFDLNVVFDFPLPYFIHWITAVFQVELIYNLIVFLTSVISGAPVSCVTWTLSSGSNSPHQLNWGP